MDSESSFASQAVASGATPALESYCGIHFCMTIVAASPRARDGAMVLTRSAAPTKSRSMNPLTTPEAALANVIPVRFASLHFNALSASYFAHPSTNDGLRRLRVAASVLESH